jgi:hypothetical protein
MAKNINIYEIKKRRMVARAFVNELLQSIAY